MGVDRQMARRKPQPSVVELRTGRTCDRELHADHRRFIDHYVAEMTAGGFRADPAQLACRARTFCRRFNAPAQWLQLSLDEQLRLPDDLRNVVAWCLCTQRISGPEAIDYVIKAGGLGRFGARLNQSFHDRFVSMAGTIGNSAT